MGRSRFVLITFVLFSSFQLLKRQEGKTLSITISILPELVEVMKNQPITMEITYDSKISDTIVFTAGELSHMSVSFRSVIIDSTFIGTRRLIFRNVQSTYVVYRIYSTIKCSDSITDKALYDIGRIQLSTNKLTKKTIQFPRNCARNTYTGGKICPTCKRLDKVIPIHYGLPDFGMTGMPGIDFQVGGCTRSNCDPDWHCKRDSTQF